MDRLEKIFEGVREVGEEAAEVVIPSSGDGAGAGILGVQPVSDVEAKTDWHGELERSHAFIAGSDMLRGFATLR